MEAYSKVNFTVEYTASATEKLLRDWLTTVCSSIYCIPNRVAIGIEQYTVGKYW